MGMPIVESQGIASLTAVLSAPSSVSVFLLVPSIFFYHPLFSFSAQVFPSANVSLFQNPNKSFPPQKFPHSLLA